MDWAVGCHLGRDKTIEKVSSRFIGGILRRHRKGTHFTMAKNIDIIIFLCYILENTILDR